LRPIAQIARLSALKELLLIYGDRDDVTPRGMGERFASACSLPRKSVSLWTVPGAEHTKAIAAAPDEYRQRVVGLFARALGGAALLSLALLAACITGSANTLAGAATMTALATGSAVAERAAGGCIAICANGTTCNPRTGFCEALPCRGLCASDQHCENSFAESKCVPGVAAGVVTKTHGSSRTTVIAPITEAPNQSSSAPSIVPAAEQPPPQ
jgi:hypothetical protein